MTVGALIYKLPPRATTNGLPHYRHRFFVNDRASGYDRTNPATWQLANPLTSEPVTKNASMYARDSFRILSNLTLNFGIRWEKQNLLDRDGKTAGADSATGNPGINLNYWAPRLGFVWDPSGSARSKVFGSWGRYYESIPADIQIRAFGGEAICFCYNLSASPTNYPPDTSVRACGLWGGTAPVEPDLTGQYIDEWVIGVEHEIMPNTTVGVKVAHRNLGSVIEDFLVISEGNYFIANPGAGTLGQTVSFYDYSEAPAPKVTRKNTDVQLTLRKRYSNNWQLLASYTWQKLEGNYDGLFQNSTGQLDPNINSAFDYGDFMINAQGRLTNERKHQGKVDASYTLSGKADGLTLGTSIRAYSGYPQTAYGYSFLYGNWEYYLTPRGSHVKWEILADEPFIVGEFIVMGDLSGTVEKLGFRSTRVRMLDQSLVTVPNKTIVNSNIRNWSRLSKRRLNMTLGIEYGNAPDAVLSVVQAIREMLMTHDLIEPDSVVVQFTDFGASSLDLMIISFMKTPGWNEFQAARQDINLKIMSLLDERGVGVAFPTHTVILESAAKSGDGPQSTYFPPPKAEPVGRTAADSPVPDDAAN